jgi:agmatine deiminase
VARPATRVARRWPAEWEPHAGTWLAWPHAPATWPGHLEDARREYVEIVRALQGRETVRLLVADAAMEDAARGALAARGVDPERGIEFLRVPTDDSWLRDTGPIVVEERGADGRAARHAIAFGFDAWGGKYPPWDRDVLVGASVARAAGLAVSSPGFVLEGGSIDGNGRGTVLTTESCLLNPNREAGRTREQMEDRLAQWLGARHVLWLGDGIAGDDTDGHVDDIARFVDAGTVVAAVSDDASDPNAAPLAENLRRLRAMRDQDGKPLGVVPLPMPPAHRIDGQLCPASYANFYLANAVALVPTFGVPADARALAVLRELLPGREVVGIPSRHLVQGLGSVHCLSQQEPALPSPASPPGR